MTNEEREALQRELSVRPDEELLRMVTFEIDDFRPEALAIARQELARRDFADADIEAFGDAHRRGAPGPAGGQDADRAASEGGEPGAGWPGASFQVLEGSAEPGDAASASPRCSFCQGTRGQRDLLIVVKGVSICDECVAICDGIVASRPARREAPEEEGGARSWPEEMSICALCRLPFDAGDCVLIPERGALCPGCVEIVRSALESPRADR